MTTPTQLSETYFSSWEKGDYDTLRTLLADDVDFVGALGQASGIEECLAGLKGLGSVITRIDVQARMASETDVITWFALHTSVAPPAMTANWSHVEGGKISRIRVAFDPRELVAGLDRATAEAEPN